MFAYSVAAIDDALPPNESALSEAVSVQIPSFETAPEFEPLESKTVAAGQVISFNLTSSIPSGSGVPVYRTFDLALPGDTRFRDLGNGLASFEWTPLKVVRASIPYPFLPIIRWILRFQLSSRLK